MGTDETQIFMAQQSEADIKRLDDALNVLGEHFDSVQIFATRHEAGEMDGTLRVSKGTGNWFARYGQVRCWLVMEDEANRKQVQTEE